MKDFATAVAIIITVLGYIPYIRNVLRRKTKPHVYTWFTWGLVAAIAFALQLINHAGVGSLVTLVAAFIAFSICAIALRNGNRNITISDTVCLLLAAVSIITWLSVDSALIAIILVSIADILGFVPTIRKSWSLPHEETAISYGLNALRFSIAIYALETYTVVTYLYPLTWLIANAAFVVFLLLRRTAIAQKLP